MVQEYTKAATGESSLDIVRYNQRKLEIRGSPRDLPRHHQYWITMSNFQNLL